MGVRDGDSTGSGVEKLPKMAGDVPVRYAEFGAGPGGFAVLDMPSNRRER